MKRTILTLIAIALLSASISAQSTEERLPTNMRCPKGTRFGQGSASPD